LLADALRLTNRERISFNIAAGCNDDDALHDLMSTALPEETRRIHGRAREIDVISRQIAAGRQRIITITGFRGVGKTRLAITVARAARSHGCNPVLWASLRQNTLDLPDTVAVTPEKAYGLNSPSPSPWAGELELQDGRLIDRVARLVEDRAALLILDGNDAGHVTHETMRELVRQCAGLRILETTQIPRGPSGEFEFLLGPLPVTPQGPAPAPALDLFLELIKEIHGERRPDENELSALVEVSHCLAGLPGALEAAASWLRILSYQQLLDIAKSEPHVLSSRPGDCADASLTALDVLAAERPESRDLLTELARWEPGWSVNDVVVRLGLSHAQAAEAVYFFLRTGIIVQVAGSEHPVTFAILNILCPLLREDFQPRQRI
jgi:hypothetical protein